jgi:hypothetical protein
MGYSEFNDASVYFGNNQKSQMNSSIKERLNDDSETEEEEDGDIDEKYTKPEDLHSNGADSLMQDVKEPSADSDDDEDVDHFSREELSHSSSAILSSANDNEFDENCALDQTQDDISVFENDNFV